MSKADEKRAFEQMMAEISDSDSDEEMSAPVGKLKLKAAAKSYSSSSTSETLTSKSNLSPRPLSAVSTENTEEDERIENFGMQVSRQLPSQVAAEQNMASKRWLMRPCSEGAPPTLCYVERDRSGFGLVHPTYRCYLEGGSDGQRSRFLMAAKKKAGSQTSYYLISLDPNPEDRGSDTVLGKIRGNGVGSQYLLTDHGVSPEKTVAPSMIRKELGIVRFEFDSGGPSRIEAWIPSLSGLGGAPYVWQSAVQEESMEFVVSNASDGSRDGRLLQLQNKKPKWDEAHGGHVLNFQGRVTESSVKNFQLCAVGSDSDSAYNDAVLLQFGRVAKDRFNMDVQYPLSIFQAFAMCVACMDGKLADRRGYEYFRKLTGGAEEKAASAEERGSAAGSKSLGGSFRDNAPSAQYILDKINRTFK